jgi:transcriptional regulator with XRE-family HTH domain
MDIDREEQDAPDPRVQASEDVGARLRVYRERSGIGVRELARRLRLSPSMISQIETGKTRPSVGTLYAVVSELAISLDELFAPNGDLSDGEDAFDDAHEPTGSSRLTESAVPPSVTEPASPMQRADRRKAIRLAGGVRWERLTAQHDKKVDFLYVVYEPGASSGDADTYMRHTGREYGIVLKGQLAVAVGFEEYALGPGDSISFASTTPHRLWNAGDESVHGIWVVIGRHAESPEISSSP